MLIPINGTKGNKKQSNNQSIIFKHYSTKNESFKEMHYFLKNAGIKNNDFMLALIDPDLMNIDPHDPNLSPIMQAKVFREVQRNFWYFIRECVRIPVEGATKNELPRYKLHRGNMALNYCFLLNLDIFLELPRQNYKTMSAECWYLWVFNFATSNSKIGFFHKDKSGSKDNLRDLKRLRECLPSYLKMDKVYSNQTKSPLKKKSTVETLDHLVNDNNITTFASARTPALAINAGRGLHLPVLWYDEYAFIIHIEIIKNAARPALSAAAKNARKFGKPHGVLITTTPGLLTTNEGLSAFKTKENSTKFNERMYDLSADELKKFLKQNTKSPYIYIKFNYRALGRGEQYLADMAREMEQNWVDFRREILLEWAEVSDKSPFDPEDLETVKKLLRQPMQKLPLLGGKYELEVFENLSDGIQYPPIMGVDVSGGLKRDSSTITILNSKTTKVAGVFNCNYISQGDLARVIYEIVKRWIPNALIVIESNGGFGQAVIGELKKTDIKRNLYKELKEKIVEERFNDGRLNKTKSLQYVYGIYNNKAIREELMELLRERMELHKDKFVSEIIYNELAGLEYNPRNNKIDHSSNTHDDQIMSLMFALYVWYYGKDVKSRYGIIRDTLVTDQNIETLNDDITIKKISILEDCDIEKDEVLVKTKELLKSMTGNSISEEDYFKKLLQNDIECIDRFNNSKMGRFLNKYSKGDTILVNNQNKSKSVPDEIFTNFYN